MSVKQERMDPSACPAPPPLLHQGLRPNPPPPYGQHMALFPGQIPPNLIMLQPPIQQLPAPGPPILPPAASQPRPANPGAGDNQVSGSEEEINKRIDKASIRGTFGWETLDGANIPCIFRNGEKYVSVRMVEQKLLSKYPSTYPDELRDRPPLMSQFITQPEAKLLNEINVEHCACEYGQKFFSERDLVVSLTDFIEFYKIVKKHFPTQQKQQPARQEPPPASGGGWVQVNNTVVPYIRRHTPVTKEVLNLAPLPVLKYAAGLLTDTSVPSLEPSGDECKLLSDMCKSSGLDFNFSQNTPLILLQQLPVYCSSKVLIRRLPDDDPFGNAEYCPEFDFEDSKVQHPQGVLLPTMQNLSPQTFVNRPPQIQGPMRGPPNVTVQPGSAMTFAGPPQHMSRQNGAQSLKALEKIAGPPKKKARSNGSPSANGQANRAKSSATPPRFSTGGPPVSMPFPQSMSGVPPPPRATQGVHMISHPGNSSNPSVMWPNAPTNPAEMQKLANMMNMQAAILSKIGNKASGSATSTITSAQPVDMNKVSTTKPEETPKKAPTSEKIQPVEFHGKKISCLVKSPKNEKFALIEAISRVYFPHCTLDEFLNALTSILQIPVYELDRDEEKDFISFYGLPTSSLKCNQVLNLADLDKLMPQLKYMFKPKDAAPAEKSAARPKPSNAGDASRQVVPADSSKSSNKKPEDSNNNGSQTSTNNNLPPANPFVSSKKPHGSGGLSKLRKLEDAVNRLRQTKLMQLENENPTSVVDPQNGVNQLGQGQIPRNPFTNKDS